MYRCFFVVLILGCSGHSDSDPKSDAQLQIEDFGKDFGTVLPGESLEASIELKNIGGENLQIKNLRTSCGCAPATIEQESLSPGQTTRINVNMHAPPQPGTFNHMVLFETNDSRHQQVHMPLKGKAEWPVDVKPSMITVPTLRVGEVFSRELRVFRTDRERISGLSIKSSNSKIKVSKPTTRGLEQVIEVSVATDKLGKIEGYLQIDTKDSHRPNIVVPVRANIIEDSQVRPDKLLLGQKTVNEQVACEVVVILPKEDKVVEISTQSADWIIDTWEQTRINEQMVRVSIKMTLPSQIGYLRSQLHLSTKKKSQPLKVGLSCYVLARSGEPTSREEIKPSQ